MLGHRNNLRQAGESSVPAQSFATPQAEIRRIRETDRTLAGFARVLEIVRDTPGYGVLQALAFLADDWPESPNRAGGQACIGAMAGWFFGGDSAGTCAGGIKHLAVRFGAAADVAGIDDFGDAVETAGNEVRAAMAAVEPLGRTVYPFGCEPWPADYAEVFYELARRHSGK